MMSPARPRQCYRQPTGGELHVIVSNSPAGVVTSSIVVVTIDSARKASAGVTYKLESKILARRTALREMPSPGRRME